jgi:hypothetical protein
MLDRSIAARPSFLATMTERRTTASVSQSAPLQPSADSLADCRASARREAERHSRRVESLTAEVFDELSAPRSCLNDSRAFNQSRANPRT